MDKSAQAGNDNRRAVEEALDVAARVGPVAAWAVGVVCGWLSWRPGDLLGAVLRGAGAWLAVQVLWIVAVRVCEALLLPAAQQAPAPEVDEEPAELRRAA